MIKNKGFTVYELLISFIFLSFITFSIFNILLNIKDRQALINIEQRAKSIQNELTILIENDIEEYGITDITECGINCVSFDYGVGGNKNFSIDFNNKKIRYGEKIFTMIDDSYFGPTLELTTTTVSGVGTGREDSILNLSIPILHYELEGDYGLDIVVQYDSRVKPITNDFTFAPYEDTEAPVIALSGEISPTYTVGETYFELGATATDNVDGDISDNITIDTSGLNMNTAGTYYVNYNVTDSNGNIGNESRTVYVLDQSVWEFSYTTSTYYTFNVPFLGDYRIELWGAQGGCYYGGKGGYTKGDIELTTTDTLFVYVGQNGNFISGDYGSRPATFNGGGSGGVGGDHSTYNYSGGPSGGGATDVRLASGTWSDTTSLRSRIMVAGGGGGQCDSHATATADGGGLSGFNGYDPGGSFLNYGGEGATQTWGNAFGIGGNGPNSGDLPTYCHGHAGAGGGYYGGDEGEPSGGSCYIMGGGGGSSFISGHTGCNAINSSGTHTGQPNHYSGYVFTNTETSSGVREGAGFARITILDRD